MKNAFAALGVAMLSICMASPALAFAQSFSIVVPTSNPSTAITCPTAAAGFTLSGSTFTYSGTPLPAGTAICTLSVAPAGWAGVLTLSGTNASSFSVSGLVLSVGSTALTSATCPLATPCAVTVTATP